MGPPLRGDDKVKTSDVALASPRAMFDLSAYLTRIRLPARPTLDHHGLAALQRAHRLAIPFETLDIALGRGIAIDGEAVFAKLVTAGRGGFCFEHNRLFLDALGSLGFDARPVLARVWLGASEVPPLTHVLSLVTIDGAAWIADPGFGGSYAPVMPLIDGAEADSPDGARFRLIADADQGWMLLRDGEAGATDGRDAGEGYRPQFSFTTARVWDADLSLGSHWAATAPASRFVRHRIASIVLPRGFATLVDRDYRRWTAGEETRAGITDPRVYRMRLAMMFGINLTVEDVAALALF